MAAWMANSQARFGLWQAFLCSCVILQQQLSLSAGCPSSPPQPQRSLSFDAEQRKAGPDLNDMLAEAWLKNRQDDRITLTQLAPSDTVTDSLVYRPRLGENVSFPCEVPAGSDVRNMAWLHQDRTVFEAGRPLAVPADDLTGRLYRFLQLNNTLLFQVLNVSLASSGSVQCVALPSAPAAYAPRPRVLQRYMLLPLITRRSDIFAPTDPTHLTAIEGDPLDVPCDVRLPLPEGLLLNARNHVIWRHNGRVVLGPSEAPYGAIMPTSGLMPDLEDTASSMANSTDTPFINRPGRLIPGRSRFEAIAVTDAGHIQCMFRPHQGLHEWIVHTTTLRVLAKN
ncbi:uncharacterized protein LOC129599978 [Paramacrobiotus metropolitanus]|uniref:uncharacterized protein LOC129599978 n=1 Tax=Paramacrobiotus metropolitanus TaxID=2943436 RepID=UPI0024464F8C|nr:uncharacterized protein LOC129599978 [Paramacrobiotus metropolitanus]